MFFFKFQKSKLPYYEQIEMILVTYVFPDLTTEHGYLRAKVTPCLFELNSGTLPYAIYMI